MHELDFNTLCRSLPAATYVRQWGDSHVWKVANKVFAIGVPQGDTVYVTFKTGDIGYEILRDRGGLRPAPYLASRGLKWIQHYESSSMNDTELADYIRHSYQMVCDTLSRKKRLQHGL